MNAEPNVALTDRTVTTDANRTELPTLPRRVRLGSAAASLLITVAILGATVVGMVHTAQSATEAAARS